MRRSILFHQKRHPREMGRPEIEALLIHVATEQRVAAATQNQARSAISVPVSLYS
ncbi:phage integrase N-terminal SAM-like domain-containing protein [Candidatus Chloroploca sp. Khr17]|uniref:phage integrase N-terminal SAM-like domain-containing protein n=1 Tax=Candidatus Chloroploca sp. Khr17 TaxID=2496869 RepID=UPI001F0E0344|nr:phage integrase N-terminal SAM-like domain-containing protein [Candidatus Chloroploca sp. Khr17]